MSQWSSEQYLKFKNQRTQPSIDLVKRISSYKPQSILDIGCGPGNSTKVLRDAFPDTYILGVDSSQDMIKKAKNTYSNIDFKLCDVYNELDTLGIYDIIFSNACLQWIPDHSIFIPMLFEKLNDGGILAVQMPMNGREPLFVIADEAVKEQKWGFSSFDIETNETLSPEEYFDILSSCAKSFDIWETVYYHSMPSINAMVEWIKGTRLRPYLNVLDARKAEDLENEIADRAASIYKSQKNGEFIFKFRRFFFTAVK